MNHNNAFRNFKWLCLILLLIVGSLHAQVIDGNARFSILSPTLIRMEYAGNAKFEDKNTINVINRNFGTPAYTSDVVNGWREIKTDKLFLRYKQGSGIFSENNLTIQLDVNGKPTTVSPFGSATGYFQFNEAFEAEHASLLGGADVNTNHASYSGEGFVDRIENTGTGIKWFIDGVPSNTNAYITIRYSNGYTVSKTMNLYVNGVMKTLTFAPTGSWDSWSNVQTAVNLTAGSNTASLVYDAGNSGQINLDWAAATSGTTVSPPVSGNKPASNLGGWRRELGGLSGPGKLHDGMLSRAGWYLFDDSETVLMETNAWPVPRTAQTGGYRDTYFFGYGLNYKTALTDFYSLTGNPPLLPRWVFGNWYSKYHPFKASEYMNDLLPKFRSEKVPLDVLVVDTDWKSPSQWNGWNWNTNLFPNPANFISWAHTNGLHVPFNTHPSISNNDPKFSTANATGGGLINLGNNMHGFDIAKEKHAKAYFDLHEPFNKQGVDLWWLDWCDEGARLTMAGLPGDAWYNYLYAKNRRDQGLRGFAISRIGAGRNSPETAASVWSEHRNTIAFTGDTYESWAMLRFESVHTIKTANVGIPYVSHDIGGHQGGHIPDDMYLRWVQFGAFQPVLRLHSTMGGHRLPWEYPNVRTQAEKFLRLRHALLPYTYSLSHISASGGLPMVQGMYWHYPTIENAYTFDHQYMFGEQMLVAPIVSGGANASVNVWFPAGTWTNFFTNEKVTGPLTKSVSADYNTMPVYVKEGGIIPMQPYMDYAGQKPQDELLLNVYTGSNGLFTLYEDEGEGLNYQSGNFGLTDITFQNGPVKLVVAARKGTYTGAVNQRKYDISFINITKPTAVLLNGSPLAQTASGQGWSFSNNIIKVHLDLCPVNTDQVIEVLGISTGMVTDDENNVISIFPNPSTDKFQIETSGLQIDEITITDLSGRVISSDQSIFSGIKTIDVGHISKGIYMVNFKVGSQWIIKKLVIQ